MPLGEIHQKTLPDWFRKHENDPDYQDVVDSLVKGVGTDPMTEPESWIQLFKGLTDMRNEKEPEKGRKPFVFHRPTEFMRGMLTGKVDLKSAGTTPLKPDAISTEATKHKELAKSVHGQTGVPLEIRKVGDANTASLFDKCMEIVRQVRLINTKHMKEKDREKLLKDADT
jgi:hypothetical protein